MEKNYTPLNIEALRSNIKTPEKRKGFDSMGNTIFLALATFTVLVISIVIFVIMQKNFQGHAGRLFLLPVASSGIISHG